MATPNTNPVPNFRSSIGTPPPQPFIDHSHIAAMNFQHFTDRAVHHILYSNYALGTLPLLCRVTSGSVPDFPLMVAVDDILPELRKFIAPVIAPRVIQGLKMELFDGKGFKFSTMDVTDRNVTQLVRLSGMPAQRGLLVVFDRPKGFGEIPAASQIMVEPCVQPNHLRTQIANLVRVTAIRESNPQQSFAVRVKHQLPKAHEEKQKTYDMDVVFADEDDGEEDVCWSFQIVEGEDMLNRLLTYAQGFGKHATRRDHHHDEYVIEFQRKINGLWVRRLAMDHPGSLTIIEEGDEVWDRSDENDSDEKPDENGLSEDGVEEKEVHGSRVDEDGKDR